MSDLKQQWLSLKSSERLLLLYGTFFIVLSLLYFYAWKPYQQSINNLQQQILYTQEDLSWLKQVSSQIQPLKSGTPSTIGTFKGSMINVIDKSIKKNRLNKFVKVLENSGDDKVVVQFNMVAFNPLIQWLGYIKKRYGLIIKNIDLQREGEGDKVNAHMILIRV